MIKKNVERRQFEGLREMPCKIEFEEWLFQLELKEREVSRKLASVRESLSKRNG